MLPVSLDSTWMPSSKVFPRWFSIRSTYPRYTYPNIQEEGAELSTPSNSFSLSPPSSGFSFPVINISNPLEGALKGFQKTFSTASYILKETHDSVANSPAFGFPDFVYAGSTFDEQDYLTVRFAEGNSQIEPYLSLGSLLLSGKNGYVQDDRLIIVSLGVTSLSTEYVSGLTYITDTTWSQSGPTFMYTSSVKTPIPLNPGSIRDDGLTYVLGSTGGFYGYTASGFLQASTLEVTGQNQLLELNRSKLWTQSDEWFLIHGFVRPASGLIKDFYNRVSNLSVYLKNQSNSNIEARLSSIFGLATNEVVSGVGWSTTLPTSSSSIHFDFEDTYSVEEISYSIADKVISQTKKSVISALWNKGFPVITQINNDIDFKSEFDLIATHHFVKTVNKSGSNITIQDSKHLNEEKTCLIADGVYISVTSKEAIDYELWRSQPIERQAKSSSTFY